MDRAARAMAAAAARARTHWLLAALGFSISPFTSPLAGGAAAAASGVEAVTGAGASAAAAARRTARLVGALWECIDRLQCAFGGDVHDGVKEAMAEWEAAASEDKPSATRKAHRVLTIAEICSVLSGVKTVGYRDTLNVARITSFEIGVQ